MVEIREIKVFSKKLNKDIILEAYTGDKDGVTVITATSLKNEFEKIKDEYGITDSISSDVRINSAGNITYTPVSRAFIQMCVLHQIKDSDENKMAIIDYIAKKAEANN